jgi:hypothetical protein
MLFSQPLFEVVSHPTIYYAPKALAKVPKLWEAILAGYYDENVLGDFIKD